MVRHGQLDSRLPAPGRVALTGKTRGVAARGDRTGEGLEALLRALDPDRERAAGAYEDLRRRLLRFFTWRRGQWPDELVDDTLDRVARRLAGGEVIHSGDVGRYSVGVARNVLRESWHHEQRAVAPAALEHAPRGHGQPAVDDEARLECLERCLAALDPPSRELVLGYYQGEGPANIAGRRVQAARLGLAAGALRIRVHRLRLKLEACVRNCLAPHETSPLEEPPSREDDDR
jgi:DNA-directed RNA polymerase specialized sigma24 family protein